MRCPCDNIKRELRIVQIPYLILYAAIVAFIVLRVKRVWNVKPDIEMDETTNGGYKTNDGSKQPPTGSNGKHDSGE